MPKIPAGAVYKPVQQIPDGATYDTPEASKQTLDPSQPGMQPASSGWFDRIKGLGQNIYDSTIPGMVSKVADVGSQYMNAKANERQKANEVAAAQGKPAPNSNAATTALRMGSDTAALVSGADSPTGIATTGAVMAAPVTAGLGLAGLGAYKAYQNKDALANLFTTGEANPDETREGLNGLAMAVGGAAGAGKSAPSSMEGIRQGFNKWAVPGSPSDLLVRATKPTVGLPDYKASLDRTIPDLFSESKPIKTLDDLTSSADALRDKTHGEYRDLVGQVKKPIDTTGVVDRQMSSIPATNLRENPGIVDQTSKVASSYLPKVLKTAPSSILDEFGQPFTKSQEINQQMFAPEAEAIHVDTNAKLRGFYNKAAGDKWAALSNPETARTHAVNTGIRDTLYGAIEDETGVNPTKMQQKYGDLVDIGDTAGKRDTVFSRQQPIPLAQQLSTADALANGKPLQVGASMMFKRLNDPNWLTAEAFDRYGRSQNPVKPPFPYGQFAASMAASGKRR